MSSNTIENWSDLNELLDRYASGYVFRGQPEPEDNLRSSFARELNGTRSSLSKAVEIEGRAILRFAKAAHHFLRPQEVPSLPTTNLDALAFGERLDWLAIMQQYRVPTRLLDWTESLFVAAYFAVEKKWRDNGELWVCHVDSLRDGAAKTLAFASPEKAFDGFGDRNELHQDKEASPLFRTLEDHPERRPVGLDWERWKENFIIRLQSVLEVICEMRQPNVDLLVHENEFLPCAVFPMAIPVVTDRIHAQQG